MQQWYEDKRQQIEAHIESLRARAQRIETHRSNEARMLPSEASERAQLHDNDEVVEALEVQVGADLPTLEAALARIADGTYGTCIECEAPIARSRLDILPATPRCVACARRSDLDAHGTSH